MPRRDHVGDVEVCLVEPVGEAGDLPQQDVAGGGVAAPCLADSLLGPLAAYGEHDVGLTPLADRASLGDQLGVGLVGGVVGTEHGIVDQVGLKSVTVLGDGPLHAAGVPIRNKTRAPARPTPDGTARTSTLCPIEWRSPLPPIPAPF